MSEVSNQPREKPPDEKLAEQKRKVEELEARVQQLELEAWMRGIRPSRERQQK